MVLAATGLFLSGARGAQADHQRCGYNRDDQGSRYQRSDWHAERAVPQDERRGRGDAWRSDAWRSAAADRAAERGHGRWEQTPFAYIPETDRGHRGTDNRQPFGRGFGDRNGRGTYRGGTANRGAGESMRRGDRDHDHD